MAIMAMRINSGNSIRAERRFESADAADADVKGCRGKSCGWHARHSCTSDAVDACELPACTRTRNCLIKLFHSHRLAHNLIPK